MAARADLDALNRIAADKGLRNNLTAWVAQGLELATDVDTSIRIEYGRGETPMSATVTTVQDGLRGDSVRGERRVMEFSRQWCSRCPQGVNPWTLQTLETTQRCWEDRGHDDYSAQACD